MAIGLLLNAAGGINEGEAALNPAMHGATLFMLGLLVCLLTCIIVAAVVLARRARRAEPPEQSLIREVLDAENRRGPKKTPSSRHKHPRKEWERDPDWWKNS